MSFPSERTTTSPSRRISMRYWPPSSTSAAAERPARSPAEESQALHPLSKQILPFPSPKDAPDRGEPPSAPLLHLTDDSLQLGLPLSRSPAHESLQERQTDILVVKISQLSCGRGQPVETCSHLLL